MTAVDQGSRRTSRPRASAVPLIYGAIMAEVEKRRQERKWPMWMTDEKCRLPDRCYSKYLHAATPSGRIASWKVMERIIDTLFPRGVRVKLIPLRGREKSCVLDMLSIELADAHSIGTTKNVGGPWIEHLRAAGKRSGETRKEKISPAKRNRIAKKAAKARWAKLPPWRRRQIARQMARRRWRKE